MAYIGAEPVPGQNREVDDISSGFNGNATAFTLQVSSVNVSPESANNILINLGGVLQNPGTDYTIAASTITFTTAPAAGLSFFGLILGAGINTATVADGTIGTAKVVDNSITADKLAHTSVTAGSYTTADITVDAQGRITAAANGTIATAEIADGAVNNAKVNASAAIAGTKISPDFGSQNIVTTGGLTVDTNTLHVDASNNRVGIGTTSPSVSLDIESTQPTIRFTDSDASGTPECEIKGGGGDLVLSADRDNEKSSTLMQFQTDGSTAMTIDSSQNVGIGTTSPTCKLQVNAGSGGDGTVTFLELNHGGNDTNDAVKLNFARAGGDIGSISLEKVASNNTTDFIFNTRASNTVSESMRITGAGSLIVGAASGTGKFIVQDSSLPKIQSNFNNAAHFESGVGGSGGGFAITSGHFLTFNHQPYANRGSDTNLTERMRIDSSGKVGIGLTSLVAKFSVSENANLVEPMRIDDTNNTDGNRHRISFRTGNTEVGKIVADRSSTTYTTSSDYRLKENETIISDGITRLKNLKPYKFNFKIKPEKIVDGFFAHEVGSVVPEAISGTKDEVDSDNNPIYQGIDQSKLVPLLTAALQEAVTKIETLETKVAALEAA